MELSVREAATLLGQSPRTLRARLARGDLAGRKLGGRWRIDRRELPLTEAQRRALETRAEELRRTVEAALPTSLRRSAERKHRRIEDLDAFRLAHGLLLQLRDGAPEPAVSPARRRAARYVEAALLALAECVHRYDAESKLAAVRVARSRLARAAGVLLVEADVPPAEPVAGWVQTMETEVLPAVAGLARWAESLARRSR